MRLLIVLIVALITIFGSLLGLRRCEGSELPSNRVSPPLSSLASR